MYQMFCVSVSAPMQWQHVFSLIFNREDKCDRFEYNCLSEKLMIGQQWEEKKKTNHPHEEKSVKGDTSKQEMHLEDGK